MTSHPSNIGIGTILPFKSHPLYRLRYATIINAVVGIILNLIASSTAYYDSGPFVWTIFLLFVSFLSCLQDLCTWALAKATTAAPLRQSEYTLAEPVTSETGDEKPKWPTRKQIVGDAIFAVVFQWTFWAVVSTVDYNYSSRGKVIQSYAALANLVGSILHAVAFWKELMAMKHASWLRKLERKPCPGCGYAPASAEDNMVHHHGDRRPSLLGSIADKVRLPKWATGRPGRDDVFERDAEAEAGFDGSDVDLLVTPDESQSGPSTVQGYGTLAESVRSLNSEAEKVMKKKGKKRVVGE